MDQPGLAVSRHFAALGSIGRLNRVSGAAAAVSGMLRTLARRLSLDRPMRVLDMATGGGDIPIRLSRPGAPWCIDGCDISETALDYARQRAAQAGRGELRFFQHNALRDPMPEGYDAVVFSLFLHHLTDEQCVEVMAGAAESGAWVLVNDLQRSALNLMAVNVAARLLCRSDVVHADAPLSVRAAFARDELAHLARQAGLAVERLETRFPARLILMGRPA